MRAELPTPSLSAIIHPPLTDADPGEVVITHDHASDVTQRRAEKRAEPISRGKRKPYRCSACGLIGHNSLSQTCPRSTDFASGRWTATAMGSTQRTGLCFPSERRTWTAAIWCVQLRTDVASSSDMRAICIAYSEDGEQATAAILLRPCWLARLFGVEDRVVRLVRRPDSCRNDQ